jgi:hypothetical protein
VPPTRERHHVVEAGGGHDDGGDALGDAVPALLHLKHGLDHDGGAHSLEDEAQGEGKQRREAQDAYGRGARHKRLGQAGDEQQPDGGGAHAAEDLRRAASGGEGGGEGGGERQRQRIGPGPGAARAGARLPPCRRGSPRAGAEGMQGGGMLWCGAHLEVQLQA